MKNNLLKKSVWIIMTLAIVISFLPAVRLTASAAVAPIVSTAPITTYDSTTAVVGGSGLTRTVLIYDITGKGSIGFSIDSSTASDTAGNTAPSAGSSTTFIVDNSLPTIDIQPVEKTVTAGDNTCFTVEATGLNQYQWMVNLGNGFMNVGESDTCKGAKTSTLTITNVTSDMNGRVFKCVVTGSNGLSVDSNGAKLTVNTPPTISSQPSNVAIMYGENTSFTVAASATAIHYQWQVKSSSSFTNIDDGGVYSGTKTATLSITKATGNMNGLIYQVVISGLVPKPVSSAPVTLTVYAPPTIITEPVDTSVAIGDNTSFTVEATGLNQYQWMVNLGNGFMNVGESDTCKGAKTSTLTITNVKSEMNGRVYQCVITGEKGQYSTSRSATLMVGNVTTQAVSGIHSTSATGNGYITTLVGPNLTQHGVVWSTFEKPEVSLTTKTEQGAVNSIGAFTSNITGLSPGTTYHVRAYASNSEGTIYGSDVTFTTSMSLGGGGNTTIPSTSTKVEGNHVGNSATATIGEKTVTTVTVDNAKITEFLESRGAKQTVTLSANNRSNVVIGELSGQTVKNMEKKEAVLEIKTQDVTYTLPAAQINIDDVSAQIGSQVALKDIKVSVKIAEPSADTVKIVENTANKNSYQIVVKPVEFEITCTSGNKTVDVSKFNGYVERTVAIPDGVDPSKITTGIVLNSDGTFSHVPTQIVVINNGKHYAKVNSLTNSTYSVIWNPVTFTDVANHWSKNTVNDMGSRMVVTGTGNGNYEPGRSITRAEFAAIAVRAMGLQKGTTESNFGDVTLTDWFNGYVDTATAYSLITGYNSKNYGPDDMITREQAMAILARAMKLTGLNTNLTDGEKSTILSKYTDGASISDYAKTSAAMCIKTGVVTGSSATTLSPKAYVTRAEIAAMVQRLLQKSGLI